MSNHNNRARQNKNDEFHTSYKDVEKELQNYSEYFRGKIVYCPCDSDQSPFVRYFMENFEKLGLMGLTYSGYDNNGFSNIGSSMGDSKFTKILKDKDLGDFRGVYGKIYMDLCDVVVTNPPFSLGRKFMQQVFDYKKDYLVIGPLNWIPNPVIAKEVLKNNCRAGVNNGTKEFTLPDGTTQKLGNCVWYTNLPTPEKASLPLQDIPLSEYQRYDNYPDNYVEIGRVSKLPQKCEEILGVPLSYFTKHNPDDFEIVGFDEGVWQDKPFGHHCCIDEKEKFRRIFIQHKNR